MGDTYYGSLRSDHSAISEYVLRYWPCGIANTMFVSTATYILCRRDASNKTATIYFAGDMQPTAGQESGNSRGDRANETPLDYSRDTTNPHGEENVPAHAISSSQLGEYTYSDVDKIYYLQHDKYDQYEQLTDKNEKKDFVMNNCYKVEERDTATMPTVTR